MEDRPGMSVMSVRGCGHRHEETGRDHQMEELVPHAKVEVLCRDDQVARIIAAIQQAARTGLHGDGKVYVTHVEQAVRIETGDRGESAV